MASSGDDYEIVVPESVAEQFERLAPGGWAQVLDALDALAADPSLGVRVTAAEGPGPMSYAFVVERPPLVFRIAVGYRFGRGERTLVLTGAVYVEVDDDDEEDPEVGG